MLEKIAFICASLGVIYALEKAFFFSHITCFLGFSVCGHSNRSRLGILAEKPERRLWRRMMTGERERQACWSHVCGEIEAPGPESGSV